MARLPITDRPLWQISVTTSREAGEAVAALLENLFGQAACTYSPADEDASVVTVYSTWAADQVRAKRGALRAGLKLAAECQLATSPARIVIRKVPKEDWATSWKRHFRPIRIGDALLIKPTWSKEIVGKGQAVVTLDPGLSFGTGQHATTAFCLRQLVEARQTGQSQSFLDIGTGSGILAIAAVKLGYSPVRAIDNDPVAARSAEANARKNRVAPKLIIARQDLTRLPLKARSQYDVICANLVLDLLIAERDRVLNRLRPGGKLVLAGLFTHQFKAIEKAYKEAGLKLQSAATEREWRSGTFALPG